MFRVSQHPSSVLLKSVTAASGTRHNIDAATSLGRGHIGTLGLATFRRLRLQFLLFLMMGAVTAETCTVILQ